MARGWESKSIEIQIEEAGGGFNVENQDDRKASEKELGRRLEGLLLQRSSVLQEIAFARNQRYRSMLEEKLNHLDSKIRQFR